MSPITTSNVTKSLKIKGAEKVANITSAQLNMKKGGKGVLVKKGGPTSCEKLKYQKTQIRGK